MVIHILPCDRIVSRDVLALATAIMSLRRQGFRGSVTAHFSEKGLTAIEHQEKVSSSDLMQHFNEED
jgi:hypothetical protein